MIFGNMMNQSSALMHAENLATRGAKEILAKCDDILSELLFSPNESSTFPEYMHCEHCNVTPEELETLVLSGVCTHSDFSTYLPVIYQMYAAIFILAILGNSLVIYTVATSRKMHTVTNFFIVNLAVGDLLIMVFCVPFSVASIIVLQYWPFGEGLCIFVNYCQAISIFVSSYTLVAISVDRYLAIVYPLRLKLTRGQAKVIIGMVWSLALVTTLPIAIFSGLDPTESRIYEMYEREICVEVWPDDDLKKYYTMTLMALQYFFPLLVLMFTYSRIAWKVWGTRPGKTVSKNLSFPAALNLDPPSGLLRKNTMDHSPAKMIRITLTVVLVYSFCWLPFNILIVLTDFCPEIVFWPHLHHVWFVFHWLAMSHTCYNPLILFWLNIKFREGFLNVLQRLLPCLRPRISRYLLMTRRSVVGLRRDHASNTITGSSRVSVSNRHLADPRARRLSLFADQVFAPQPRSVEIPLTEIRSNFYNYSTDKNGTTNNRERKYSEPLPGHYTYALPAGASDQEPSPFWRMSFFNSPRTAISQEF